MTQHLPDPLVAARTLGVAPDAPGEDVRAAYLRLLKDHPPDRDPEGFERLRDAYDVLRDPGLRAALLLFAGEPDAPLVKLIDDEPKGRHFVGPEPWLAALNRR